MALRRLALVALLLAGCAPGGSASSRLAAGMSQVDVRDLLGPPDAVQTFLMPEAPFFGPQELLTGQVSPGTEVTEWQFERGERVLYVWFTGGSAEASAVVDFSDAPAGAVY